MSKKELSEDEKLDLYYGYFEKAENTDSLAQKKKYYKQALKLMPDDIDAKVAILQIEEAEGKNIFHLLEKIEEIILEEEKKLKKDSYFDQDMGDFWLVFETRPYMRALRTKLDWLCLSDRKLDAIELAEYMVKLCTNDNLGIRYTLMALYAEMMNLDSALNLCKQYSGETGSPFFDFPLAILYFQFGLYDECRNKLKNIKKANKYLLPFFCIIDSCGFEVPDIDMYSFNTPEEAMVVLNTNYPYAFNLMSFTSFILQENLDGMDDEIMETFKSFYDLDDLDDFDDEED